MTQIINFWDHRFLRSSTSEIVKLCQEVTSQGTTQSKRITSVSTCVNLLKLNTSLAIMSPTKYAVASAVAMRPNHARKLIPQLTFETGRASNVESEKLIVSWRNFIFCKLSGEFWCAGASEQIILRLIMWNLGCRLGMSLGWSRRSSTCA